MRYTIDIVLGFCLLATSSAKAAIRQQTKVIDPQRCTSIGVGPKAMSDGST